MDTRDITRALMRTDPFEMLSEAILDELAPAVRVLRFAPNTYVFRQGQVSLDCLFVVVSGMVEILVAGDQGEASVVGLRRSNDFFGETVVLSRQRYPGSARARAAAVCLAIYRKDLERLIYRYPDFSGFFNALLAERMRLLYEQVVAGPVTGECSRADLPLFRKRVGEIMVSPVVTCRLSDPAPKAARIMAARDIGALVVVDHRGRPRGMLTEKGMVRALIADGRYPVADCPVEKIMHPDPVGTAPGTFLGQALATMIRRRTRHLPVTERGVLVGLVTLGDLVRTGRTGALLLAGDIDAAQSMSDLSAVGRRVDRMLSILTNEGAPLADIFEVMSRLHERLARRVIRLCEERLRRQGTGPPPVDYCWINMGSAARREQTLRTDQDNAIIYADPRPGQAETADAYFSRLAADVVDGLEACGFKRCRGNVMATNPRWRRSLDQWSEALDRWVGSADPEHVRTLSILLDYRPVWGNFALAGQFREKIFAAFRDSVSGGHALTRDDRTFQIPIGFLGTITTEKSGPHKGQLNLKTGGIVHLVNAARILAVDRAVDEPATLGRLDRLVETKALSAEDAAFFKASFETLMMFRIQENLKQAGEGRAPDSYITPGRLGKRQRMLLKDALSGAARLQKIITRRFSPLWMNYFS